GIAGPQGDLGAALPHAGAALSLEDQKELIAAVMLITVIADHPARREPDLCELQRADSVRADAAAKLTPASAHDAIGATNLAQPLVGRFQIAACACGDV